VTVRCHIPFLDLAAENATLRPEIEAAMQHVLASGKYLLGEELAAFEKEFASYNGCSDAVGVASGLSALALMLQAFNIGPGDEVIVPANTFIATWLAVSQVGARPVPVEPEPSTRTLNCNLLEYALTEKTRAVLAVHLYGAPCDMDALQRFCSEHGLWLLIDAAQSCGATWEGSRAACLGDAAAFSFYPTKNLGALGDAGAIVTNDIDRANHVRLLRNYGMKDRFHHEYKGVNARLEELHAAVLRVKLRHLDDLNRKRVALAHLYVRLLENVEGLTMQNVHAKAGSAWHLFTITVSCRDRLMAKLSEQEIETVIHYPVPPHLTVLYQMERGCSPEMAVTSTLADSLLSLPLHPTLGEEKVKYIAQVVRESI
jgi:dTDP-4-amino-4,6-dideoxygalactose transaminase